MSVEIHYPRRGNVILPGVPTTSTPRIPMLTNRPPQFAEVLQHATAPQPLPQTTSLSLGSLYPANRQTAPLTTESRLSPTTPTQFRGAPALGEQFRWRSAGAPFSAWLSGNHGPQHLRPLPQHPVSPFTRGQELGTLSARFESGRDGVAAIGYDAQGGTSYGTYQISSRAGTMARFLNYLEARAPEWARRLKATGPANTGGREGAMPEAWKAIAAGNPAHFAQLQHDFIKQTHYAPALRDIAERTGINLAQAPRAVQEMLWSTAVQHGAKGAADIFCATLETQSTRPGSPLTQDFITSVYATRARKFRLSSPEVQEAVQRRFQEERAQMLAMFPETSRPSAKVV